MQLQEKALYNLLRLRWLSDPSLDVKPWQVADYRALSEEELFQRLSALGVGLNKENFLDDAHNVQSPEMLADLFRSESEVVDKRGHVYLCIFELWRRFLPEKETLTLFCDELDHQIDLYDREEAEEETLEAILADLGDILDQHVDAGEAPKEIFKAVAACCAHDLERFLYDYIMDVIDDEEETYASELIDTFFEYLSDTKYFEFLRIRLFADADPLETSRLLRRLMERLREEPDFDLLLEMATFMVSFGEDTLFKEASTLLLDQMQIEGDFQDILLLLQGYFSCLDHEEQEGAIEELLQGRALKDPSTPIHRKDLAIQRLKSLL